MPFLKPYKEPRSRVLEELTKKNGLRHTIFNIKGDKYVGEWKNNLKHGKGAYLYRNKQLYEGDWKNGMKHGYGVLSHILEGNTYVLLYEGDWMYGKPQGFGKKHYPKGEYYEGEVQSGKRHGHGRMWYADGSFYDGQWANDMKDGLGLFVQSNGNRFEGYWQADKKHGHGKFYHLHSGQMQEGMWNQGVAVCTTMKDILFRQTCLKPTKYPINKIELEDPTQVYQQEYDRIATEQMGPEQEVKEMIYSPCSTRPTLSPWFYVDCCNKTFPKQL